MNKLTIVSIALLLALITVLWSCKFNLSGLVGNGNVTTEGRAISGFTKLKLDGVFKTVISQDGGPAWVKVETDQNLQEIIEAVNDGDQLELHIKKGKAYTKSTKMVVYLNVKQLSSLENKSVGSVETQGSIKSPELYLKIAAVGKTTLNIETQKLTAAISSVGVTILAGTAATADIENKSVGKLQAYDLKIDTLNLKNKAVGNVEVYAEKEMNIEHDGVGSVYYRGPATISSLKQNGIGKVSKAD
jgi:hypothetical protein